VYGEIIVGPRILVPEFARHLRQKPKYNDDFIIHAQ